jgi:hypothetical protein
MHRQFIQGLTDRGLFYWPSQTRETWLFKQEGEGTHTPVVNFIHILRQIFCTKVFLCSFSVLTIWVCIFWRKDFGAKAAHKMLVKVTPRLFQAPIFITAPKMIIQVIKQTKESGGIFATICFLCNLRIGSIS